jgi:hypothetical protein
MFLYDWHQLIQHPTHLMIPNIVGKGCMPVPNGRRYPDTGDQIREVLIHGNYMSRKDIQICIEVELTEHMGRREYPQIEDLHKHLLKFYAEPGEQQQHG